MILNKLSVQRVLKRDWIASPGGYGVGVQVQDEDGQTTYRPVPHEHNMSYLEAEEVMHVFRSEGDGEKYFVIDVLGNPVPSPGTRDSVLRGMVEEYELAIEWSVHRKVSDQRMIALAQHHRISDPHDRIVGLTVSHESLLTYQTMVFMSPDFTKVDALEAILTSLLAAFYAGATQLWLEYYP